MDNGVFLSYRRSDTSGHAGRISDDLERHYGHPIVFRDVDSIAAGTDFVEALEVAVAQARVAIVLIGDTWLSSTSNDGTRRLDDPEDHVRREVEMALDRADLTVLPVLVEGATMPPEHELPQSLQRLARLQAIELSEDRWDYDMARLVDVLAEAGVVEARRWRPTRWLAGTISVLLVICSLAALWWWPHGPDTDGYLGLWYLPNGSSWAVRQSGENLWIEETHYDSGQVWKRGPGTLDDNGLIAKLELVFEQRPFHYVHRLELSGDGNSLVGSVRRSDREVTSNLVMTRRRQ